MKGQQAEHWAAEYLQRQGLTLVARNYRCRFGEIDLIMQDKDTLVFIEVRQRGTQDFGGAAASIDQHKQHKLILTAQHYLTERSHPPPCRFDALLMSDELGCDAKWIKNAFEA